MSDPYLLLWLEAPLQSWGYDSKFSRRDTLKFPTKSGILGLVCCALGASGEQREFLKKFSSLSQNVIAYTRKKDPATLMRDFHMVGSGYNEYDDWEYLHIPKTSEGKKAVGGGTKLTYRYFLQDVAFAVILQVPKLIINVVCDALQNPVWDIYLGRKCCIPTDFIFRGHFEVQSQTYDVAQKIAEDKGLFEVFQALDGDHDGDDRFVINDVPISFGQRKEYRDRTVTIILK